METIFQYVMLIWCSVVAPYTLTVLLTAILHNRTYVFSSTDVVAGISVASLLILGLPPLGLLN